MRPVKTVAAAALAILVALGMTSAATAQSNDGGKVVLTIGVTSSSYDTLNPLVGYNAIDYDVWIPQYDTLTRKAASDFATIPGLAESWEASNDGKTYTYKLRDGLTWSDDEPLTARDVAFTINRSREE